jgi:hypothetical protein
MSYHASEDTTKRVLWHAGLGESTRQAGAAVVDCTGPAGDASRLDDALDDLVQTMAALNRELNGEVPSATTEGAEQIPRKLAYAIAEITRMLREESGLPDHAWRVETAWNAVLAGDIDDLDEHLRNERRARR